MLLNMDYKIVTKALALQLAMHACILLHQDQLDFVPTCSIFDSIRLVELCMHMQTIALDQEKAYDKIDHKYLINKFKVFRLPNLSVYN